MNEPLAFLNGRWAPASQASVPVYDAGFVLGVTVAEQLRTFGGKLFRAAEHLERLARSLAIVGVEAPMPPGKLLETAEQLIASNYPLLSPGSDLGLTIFVTPGAYPTLAPADAPHGPTLGMHTYPLPFRLWAEKYRKGESLAISTVRQVPSECWPAELKCRSRMHYFLAEQEARREHPGARALLLDDDGNVAETLTSNVLAWFEGEGLISPPRDQVLRGISLGAVAELAEALGLPFVERPLPAAELFAAGEVLLTSTPNCLLPVTTINGRAVGNGRPGPVIGQLLQAWSTVVGLDIAEQALKFA